MDIFIYDEIGGFNLTAQWFTNELAKASDPVTLHINSPGGQIFEGLAIYAAINKHPDPITIEVDGIAASIASVIAMAGQPIKMASNAMLMIHNATTMVQGDAAALKKQANTLEQVQAQLVDIYARKTKLPVRQIIDMMDTETWLSATDAHALGFIDEVMQPMRMAAHFDLSQYRNAPPIAAKPTPRMDAYRMRYAELTG
jgi:ATP-dependent Clp protease, protease subunit